MEAAHGIRPPLASLLAVAVVTPVTARRQRCRHKHHAEAAELFCPQHFRAYED